MIQNSPKFLHENEASVVCGLNHVIQYQIYNFCDFFFINAFYAFQQFILEDMLFYSTRTPSVSPLSNYPQDTTISCQICTNHTIAVLQSFNVCREKNIQAPSILVELVTLPVAAHENGVILTPK